MRDTTEIVENETPAETAMRCSMELFKTGGIKKSEIQAKADEMLQWITKMGEMSAEEIMALPVTFIQQPKS